MKNANLENDLKRNGLKNTKCRTVILDILEQSAQPIAAETVYLHISERNMSVSLSTVYRTLDALADKNLITKLNIMGEDKTFFEYNSMVHKHYLICLSCKRIRPIEYCPLKDYEESLQRETNYLISGHNLNIYGYCPECKENIDTVSNAHIGETY
jgi:Fur family ferric uptake transcriptional regulator